MRVGSEVLYFRKEYESQESVSVKQKELLHWGT